MKVYDNLFVKHEVGLCAMNLTALGGRYTTGIAVDLTSLCNAAAEFGVMACGRATTIGRATGCGVCAENVTTDCDNAALVGIESCGMFDNASAKEKGSECERVVGFVVSPVLRIVLLRLFCLRRWVVRVMLWGFLCMSRSVVVVRRLLRRLSIRGLSLSIVMLRVTRVILIRIRVGVMLGAVLIIRVIIILIIILRIMRIILGVIVLMVILMMVSVLCLL